MTDAEADPSNYRGRLPLLGKRAKEALSSSAGVMATACMQEEDSSNTGSPMAWSSVRPTGRRRRPGWARWGGGEVRNTAEAG